MKKRKLPVTEVSHQHELDTAHLLTSSIGNKRPRIDYDDVLFSLHLDEDGFVRPYKPSESEGPPPLAIYHSSFGKAEKLVPEICQFHE